MPPSASILTALHNHLYDSATHPSSFSGRTADSNSGSVSNKYAKGNDGAKMPRTVAREMGKGDGKGAEVVQDADWEIVN
jgi:hypothetical protein